MASEAPGGGSLGRRIFDRIDKRAQRRRHLARQQGSGHIINVTSFAGRAPGAASGLYAASKFALELAPLGIRVTAVAPAALLALVKSEAPPRQLRRAREGLTNTLADLDRWATLTQSTDFK